MNSEKNPVFSRHVTDIWGEDLPGLVASGEHVQNLLFSPGWGAVMRVIDAELALLDSELDGARSPKEQAEYALAHGRRGGLKAVSDAAKTIMLAAKARQARAETAAEPVVGRQ